MTWPMNLVISITMLLFGGWNWYLILNGTSAIEYWGSKDKTTKKRKIITSYVANLKGVFGDFRGICWMLAPSLRDL